MNSKRYQNLSTAGRELAPSLSHYQDRGETVVLAIALAGVPVAKEVARFLNQPLDLILIRRLLMGDKPGDHICAASVAGETILDDKIVLAATPSTPQETFLFEAIADLDRREQLCRRGRKPLSLNDRTVIVIDCGIRTGSTMNAAARAIRKTGAKSIIGGVPVASREGHAAVASWFDELICLQQPEQFINAGFWYADFGRPGDDEVGEFLMPQEI